MISGCGTGRKASSPTITEDYISIYPDSSKNAHLETSLNIPSDYCKRRSRLIITPLFMGSDSLEISLPSIVLDSPIYRKKINRLTVLEEYKDKYADNARTVKPRKNFMLPCQFDIKIPENASNGSLKLSFEREGCGRCTPLNDLSIASYTDPYTLFDIDQPMKLCWMESKIKEEPKIRNGSGLALIMFEINRSEIDMSRGNNRAEMEKMLNTLSPILADSLALLENITISGLASPDGSLSFNTKLAYNRALSARNWLYTNLKPKKNDIKNFTVNSRPEGWEPIWQAMKDSGSAGTDYIREIIDRYSGENDDVQEYHIRKSPYWFEIRNCYLQKNRKVEYTYTYRIQNFTTDSELLEMYNKRPDAFSEQEFLRVASLVESERIKEVYTNTISYFPKSLVANNNLAVLLLDEGKTSDAVRLLEGYGLSSPEISNTLAVSYAKTGNYKMAAELLAGLDMPEAKFNLGLVKARQRRYEEALELLRPFGGVNAAILALCSGRNEEAQEIMQASDDCSPLAEYCRALAAARLGNVAVCYRHLVEACRDRALKEKAINESDFIRLHLDKALLKDI